jgi:DNA primase
MAGIIASSTVEQVRAASDIVDVIGSSLPLKRAGANFVALCPFHKEKTPSFSVNPHKQIFYCFGCHKGGDVFTFLRDYENLSFVEAVKRLADRAHIALIYEQGTGPDPEKSMVKDRLLDLHEQIARRWQTALLNDAGGQVARDYLARRGVSSEAIEIFRLGYAPEAWDDTVNWGRSKGFEPALLEQSGLVIRKEGTDRCYDRFRGRLMFPIRDEQGRVVAFSGRILSADEKTAKYVNSPETPIFTKGKVFYGLDKSRRAILDTGFAVVCEGQLDLIACFMAGVKNIVAPQGTAFTADHARLLKRYVNEVVLCFDSDNAGQNAAARVMESLLASGLAIRVAVVPEPHDPDSFIKEQGGEAFKGLIDRAEGFFDFYLKRLCSVHDMATDLGRHNVVLHMREALWKTNDLVLLDTFAQKTAQRLGVASDAVRTEFKRGYRSSVGTSTGPVAEESVNETTEPPPSARELQLLRLMLRSAEITARAAAHLRLDWLHHATIQRVIDRILRLHEQHRWTEGAAFLALFEDDATAYSLVAQCLAEERPIPNPETQLADVLLGLRNQAITRRTQEVMRLLLQPDLSEDQRIQLLNERQELLRQKQKPLEL